MAVTEYLEDFDIFYRAFREDYAHAEVCNRLMSVELRAHVMGITAVPGLHFSGFAFGGPGEKHDFTPFVVIGGYADKGGQVILPSTGEFVHSVNDGIISPVYSICFART